MSAVVCFDVEKLNPSRVIAMDRMPDVPGLACAGMPRHWFLAMRLAWALDYSGDDWLEWRLWDAAIRMARRYHWRIDPGQQRLRKMARLAIHELADPARYREADSWRLRAAAIGCSKPRWFAVWRERYEMIFRELCEWVNRAWRYIRLRLARGQETGV